MGTVTQLFKEKEPALEPIALFSGALIREIGVRIARGDTFIHLRDQDTWTAISLYQKEGRVVSWRSRGPCSPGEAQQQAIMFEGEVRTQMGRSL